MQFFLQICSKNDDLWLYPQAFKHCVDATFLLVEIRMNVEIEGCRDVRVAEEDADCFAVTAEFDTTGGETMAQAMELDEGNVERG